MGRKPAYCRLFPALLTITAPKMPSSTTSSSPTSSADDHSEEMKHHVVEKSSSSSSASFESTSLIVPQHERDEEPRDDAAHSDDDSDIEVATSVSPQEERRRFKPLLFRRLSEPVFPSTTTSGANTLLASRRSSLDNRNTTLNNSSSKKSVRFGGCLVRSYSQVLGDHPCCSTGCPLSLGWEYKESPEIKVEEYEALTTTSPTSSNASAGTRSRLSDLRLTWDERRAILHSISDDFIKRHCRQWSRQQAKMCSLKQHTSKQRSIQETFFGGSDAQRVVVDPEDKVISCEQMEDVSITSANNEVQQHQQQ